VQARAEYPERSVTIIVPTPAGGAADLVLRILANELSPRIGKSVIVENRGGGSGRIGIGAAKGAKPDGYTLLFNSSVFVLNPALYEDNPYDAIKDFEPVAELGTTPSVVAVRTDSDIKNFDDLIARVKASPGKYTYSVGGVGTPPHFMVAQLQRKLGLDMVYVPYKGAGEAGQAVVAGTTDLFVTTLGGAANLIRSNKIRVVVQGASKRSPDLPDVPTMAEAGHPDLTMEAFFALWAPAGVSHQVRDYLAQQIAAIGEREDARNRFRLSGFDLNVVGPEGLRARVAREVPMWKQVVKDSGLKLE
jgi:tripartite-type tricarboxylate transporter receptor subunit TctC